MIAARIWPALGLSLALTGCTNDYPVLARAAGDTVEFYAAGDIGATGCVAFIRVTGGPGDRTMWDVTTAGPKGEAGECTTRWPIRYGQVPASFRVTTPPRSLVPGTYALIGTGPRFWRAAFRYDGPGRPVVNFRPGSADWCTTQYPGSKPDWPSGCRIK